MEHEHKIKMLLQEYAVEAPSSTFNNDVMLRINAAVPAKTIPPLLSHPVVNLLKIIFCVVVAMLVACIFFIPFYNLPATFSVSINSNMYKQLFSFIAVFWIGMLLNAWLNKRWGYQNSF